MLPQDAQEPMSVAEMGGASLQVTIAGGRLPDGSTCDDLFAPIALPHTPLDGCALLTHSFMGFGREEAFKRVSAAGPAAAAHCSHLGYHFSPGASTSRLCTPPAWHVFGIQTHRCIQKCAIHWSRPISTLTTRPDRVPLLRHRDVHNSFEMLLSATD